MDLKGFGMKPFSYGYGYFQHRVWAQIQHVCLFFVPNLNRHIYIQVSEGWHVQPGWLPILFYFIK